LIVCKFFIKIKIREMAIESYVQEESADMWKENVLEDLEVEILEYVIVGEFLANLKKKFGGGDDETIMVVELKRIE